MRDESDFLRRYEQHQHDPERAQRRRYLIERMRGFEPDEARRRAAAAEPYLNDSGTDDALPDLREPELQPPTDAPDVSKLDHDDAVEAMTNWFYANFENPAESTPWDGREGGYIYIWGGPYFAVAEIRDAFGETATEAAICEAIEQIEHEGIVWAPNSSRIQETGPKIEIE
jgi:hypothetical protein